jgi:hypothetical protein
MVKLSTKDFLDKIYQDVNIYNLLHLGTLNNYSENSDKQSLINIQLMPHQLKSLYKMKFMENGGKYYFKSNYYTTNIGILCNKSGSGKSLSMLERISQQIKLTDNIKPIKNISSIKLYNNKSTFIKANLIIVPFYLIKQWEKYISTYSNLKAYSLNNEKDIQNIEKLLVQDTYDIYIIKDTIYNKFVKYLTITGINCIFSRIIFDNADSINIKNCQELKCSFTWYMTSTPENLIFLNNLVYYITNDQVINEENCEELLTSKIINWRKFRGISHKGLIYNTFKNIYKYRNLIDYKGIIVKCSNCLVNRYSKIPKYQVFKIKYTLPIIIKYLIENNNINLEIIENNEDLFLNNFNIYYNWNDLVNDLERKNININRLLELKKTLLKDQQLNCPICYENINKPILVTNCCYQVFHLKCIFKLHNILKNTQCPFCTKRLNIKNCCYIDKLSIEKKKSKLYQLSNLINKVTGNSLIYINKFEYNNLKNNYGIKGYFIQKKFLQKINQSKNKIFFISDLKYINGIHTKNIDNIIIAKKINKNLQNNLIDITNICERKRSLILYKLIN